MKLILNFITVAVLGLLLVVAGRSLAAGTEPLRVGPASTDTEFYGAIKSASTAFFVVTTTSGDSKAFFVAAGNKAMVCPSSASTDGATITVYKIVAADTVAGSFPVPYDSAGSVILSSASSDCVLLQPGRYFINVVTSAASTEGAFLVGGI